MTTANLSHYYRLTLGLREPSIPLLTADAYSTISLRRNDEISSWNCVLYSPFAKLACLFPPLEQTQYLSHNSCS